ncbi:helix-turn-helix domain-containing protein [Cellulomonas sp. KRMCY2]|uniref:helix-turn-helix domain-containing protein n=1 Tax=Cellulomonas sp. KRMCY2 TaxID=1304865 RepID=UPI00045EC638|nr:helix-turn-helix domain-containing protein [Cellulomonas sp. KRMCY2]
MSQNPEHDEAPRLMLTVPEAARRLSIGRSYVYQLMLLGELETVLLGRLRRVPADCLVEYVERLRREQNPDPDEPVGE